MGVGGAAREGGERDEGWDEISPDKKWPIVEKQDRCFLKKITNPDQDTKINYY